MKSPGNYLLLFCKFRPSSKTGGLSFGWLNLDKNLKNSSMANEHENSKITKVTTPERIIVIGASTGGFEAIKKTVRGLPADFSIPIFIVWHMSPDVRGVMPEVLNRLNKIFADHAYHDEEIKPHRIYIAPPDHHMLVEGNKILLTRGPKENRFRPAVDPLFRSAAYSYRHRVIGVILSGALDDGTAGLWTVKHQGGTTVVQDPMDAEVPSMPENAMREVDVDHIVRADELAGLLVRLSNTSVTENTAKIKDEQTKKEIEIAAESKGMENGKLKFGELTPYTCPECQGVLSRLRNGNIVRYRCHTGHAYSSDVLIAALTEKVEDSLYNAVRAIDESVILLNHLGDHSAEVNQPKLAAIYFKKAKEAQERSELVRKAALRHEQLNKDSLRKEAEDDKK
jgi:two-component system chemotaxis response regulator CheB